MTKDQITSKLQKAEDLLSEASDLISEVASSGDLPNRLKGKAYEADSKVRQAESAARHVRKRRR